MRFRELGTSGLKVSEIGFGCWTLGGPNWNPTTGQAIGWTSVSFNDALAGVRAGLEAGVNHWDNADVYGNGHAERLLARCLHTLGAKPDSQVVATKVGHFRGTAPFAYEPTHIRRQCEQSLRNLRRETIDLYYFHHATFVGPDADAESHDYLPEAAEEMRRLVKEGKVRAVGLSGYNDDEFERAIPVIRPHVIQCKANLRFDQFLRPGSRLQALMDTYRCSFIAFGPLDQGILLDKFDPDKPPTFGEGEYRASRKDFAPETLRAVRAKLAKVKERFAQNAGSHTDPVRLLASVAQRWLLAHPHVCSVIPGFRNDSQARCNVSAATDPPMSDADVIWLRQLFST